MEEDEFMPILTLYLMTKCKTAEFSCAHGGLTKIYCSWERLSFLGSLRFNVYLSYQEGEIESITVCV